MIKKLTSLLMLTMFLFAPIMMTVSVSAQFDPLDKACEEKVGSGGADQICEKSKGAKDEITGNTGIITRIANILSFVAAIIAVFVIIIAGITMMTSGGDPSKVANSRNTIIYAAIGLIVIVLARTIVLYVFGSV
jgi:hypothetical protein